MPDLYHGRGYNAGTNDLREIDFFILGWFLCKKNNFIFCCTLNNYNHNFISSLLNLKANKLDISSTVEYKKGDIYLLLATATVA